MLQVCLDSPYPIGRGLGAGGPSEATSLERLFSMALVIADKAYQLISPSHRQTESARVNGTPGLHWLPALLVREGAGGQGAWRVHILSPHSFPTRQKVAPDTEPQIQGGVGDAGAQEHQSPRTSPG